MTVSEISPLLSRTLPPPCITEGPQQPAVIPCISLWKAYHAESYPGTVLTRPLRSRMIDINSSESCLLFKLILKIVAYVWYGPKALWGTWQNYGLMNQAEADCATAGFELDMINRKVLPDDTYALRVSLSNQKLVIFDITSQVTAEEKTLLKDFIHKLAQQGISVSQFEPRRHGDFNIPTAEDGKAIRVRQERQIRAPSTSGATSGEGTLGTWDTTFLEATAHALCSLSV